MKKTPVFLLLVLSMLTYISIGKAQEIGYANDLAYLEFIKEPSYPGMTNGTGTSFELTNSDYLNIFLESSNTVTLSLESVPETISINIGADPDAGSTEITLRGFLPNTVYHKYEDSYKNHISFITDTNGKYVFKQDISESHLIFIQPRPSTNFINDDETGGDCVSFGIWDIVTKTCTMTSDPVGAIEILSDNITLDGNQRKMVGPNTGSAVYLSGRSGITVKNLIISNFSNGIYLNQSNNINIEGISASLNSNGIYLNSSHNIHIVGNATYENKIMGINLNNSSFNTIENNTSNNNIYSGILLRNSDNNSINNNSLRYNGPLAVYVSYGQAGILLISSSDNKISNNTIDQNRDNGIYINAPSLNYASSGNVINGNIITSNWESGLILVHSIENIPMDNTIATNSRGVYLWYSNKNSIKNNTILNNIYAGMELKESVNNSIYNNLFRNNINLTLASNEVAAFWNIEKTEGVNIVNGPNTGGNYWSNLSEKGFSDTCADSDYDGICDESYVLDSNNIDYYPLSKPDLLPPATSISFQGSLGTNYWYTSEVEITLAATDNLNGSGISKTEYSFDSSNWHDYVSTFIVNTEGYFTIYYRSTDNSGNIETIKSAIFKIDMTVPNINGSVETLPNLNGWYNHNVTLNFTCNDAISGPINSDFSAVISVEGSNLSRVGECKDNAGNSSFLELGGINIDKTAPIVQSVLSPGPNSNGWNNTPVAVVFTAEDNISGIDGQMEISSVIGLEGEGQAVSYMFADKAGNYTYYSVSSINIDLTPPEITGEAEWLPNGENWYNSNIVVHFNCSDNLSGIESCSDNVLISTEGADQIAIGAAIDIAGNLSNVVVDGINLDKTSPQTIINTAGVTGISPWYISDVLVSLTANDGSSGSGIFKTEYSFNNIDWNDYLEPFVVNESEVIYFRSMDKASNVEPTNMKIIRIDQTPPLISGEATTQPNSNGWYNENVTIHFTASDLVSGISMLTSNVILEEEGEAQSVTGNAVDNAGNEASFTVGGISIDKTSPFTEIIISRTIEDNFVFAGTEITFLASDTFSGIENTIYNIDNSAEWVIYSEPLLISEEGDHIVRYKSIDRAGNVEEESVKEFIVDNTPPEAVIKFDIDSKDIKVYSAETGNEATYVILPSLGSEINLNLIDKSDKDLDGHDLSGKNTNNNSKKEQKDSENNDNKNTDDEGEKSDNDSNENTQSVQNIDDQDSQKNNNKNKEENAASLTNFESSVSIEKEKESKSANASSRNSNSESQQKENAKKIHKEKHDIEDLGESDVNEDEDDSEDNGEAWELRRYVLKDAADNFLTITLNHKNEGKEAKVKIISTGYNSASAKDVSQNKIYAEYSLDQDGLIKNLELKNTVKGQFDAAAKYMSKTNETEITIKLEEEKKRTGETWEGIVILEIVTDKGKLLLNY